MSQQQIPEVVAGVLDVLADKFGTTGAHLWEVMVYQQYLDAITTLGSVVGAAALCALGGAGGWRIGQKYDWDDAYAPTIAGFVLVIVAAFGFFSTIVVGVKEASSIVSGLMNPEYGAIHEILRSVRGIG